MNPLFSSRTAARIAVRRDNPFASRWLLLLHDFLCGWKINVTANTFSLKNSITYITHVFDVTNVTMLYCYFLFLYALRDAPQSGMTSSADLILSCRHKSMIYSCLFLCLSLSFSLPFKSLNQNVRYLCNWVYYICTSLVSIINVSLQTAFKHCIYIYIYIVSCS